MYTSQERKSNDPNNLFIDSENVFLKLKNDEQMGFNHSKYNMKPKVKVFNSEGSRNRKKITKENICIYIIPKLNNQNIQQVTAKQTDMQRSEDAT